MKLKVPWSVSDASRLSSPCCHNYAAVTEQLAGLRIYFWIIMAPVPSICRRGSSWAQHEPAALTLRAGTSRQQPAGRPPSSSRTGKHTIITPFVLQIEHRDTVRRVSEAESPPPTRHQGV